MAKKKKIDFTDYHQQLLGDRWEALAKALKESVPHYELKGLKSYFLDEASVWVAEELEVQPGQRVLDLCAAPGGKTLVLAKALNGEGALTSNDRSANRRARLKKVIEEHLDEKQRSIVRVTGHDAAKWGLFETGIYDRILLDAPCSSERHVFNSPEHLKQWSPARAKNMAITQYAILCAAMTALKIGGELVYSTCSINPIENEEVIAKFLKKRKGVAEVIPRRGERGEERLLGYNLWPDQLEGRGPLYFCRLRKVAEWVK